MRGRGKPVANIRWRMVCAVLFLPPMFFGYAGAAQSSNDASGGAAARGAKLIEELGCGACHVIPGIHGANGLVGPSLSQVGKRIYIAGVLRNTPDNMIRWLRHPQAIVPNNAMPDMHLSEQQARDIASYLYTLE
jgi:cytochrome c2